MSGDWRRLHRVRRVCNGSPKNHWVTRLSHKTEAEDSTRECGHPGQFNRPGGAVKLPGAGQISKAGITTQGGRSDRPGLRRREASKRRTHVGIARPASRLSRLRSPGIRPMKISRRFPNPPLKGMYP
jgi:hypothetical protein